MSKWGDDMKKQKNGFTLIELVVVIAVLGILAALGIMRISDSMASARGSKVVGDLRTLDSAITIYNTTSATALTSLDQLADNEIATVPTPPKGDFTVVTTAGTEKSYDAATYNAGAYTYDTDTQRAMFCGHPVEYYLAGDVTAKTFADYAKTIADEMAAVVTIANNIDSTAPGKTAGSSSDRVTEIKEYLEENGINLAALGATSWSYNKDSHSLYYSSTDITGFANGTKVAMIRYNNSTGAYTVYTGTVSVITNKDVNGGKPYTVVRPTAAYTPSTSSSANNNQSYASAVAYYNTLKEQLGN